MALKAFSNFCGSFGNCSTMTAFNFRVINEAPTKAELKSLHKIIKKVEDDVERFSFNTSVSSFMIAVNELTEIKCA